MAQSEADGRIGSEILGYRLEALVGRGGMSVVYRASDPRLKRTIALKLLASSAAADARFRARFLRECELLASLDHPSIVPIYDAGEHDDQLYIAMRYVEGGDLRALLEAEGPLPPELALEIVSQVAAALDAAHEQGLVHRDVKPSNILLDGRGHAYLADFGLTKSAGGEAALTSAGELIGTVSYVAPEQIRGEELDARADVYSLGCVLYECLTGEVPFPRGTDLAIVYAHLEERPQEPSTLRPELPQAVDAVAAKALAKAPAQRYTSAGELVLAARQALAVVDARRSRWLHVVAAGLVAVVIATGAALAALFATAGGNHAPAGGRLVAIDPGTGRVVSSFDVGPDPRSIAVGGGRIWVASFGDGSLWQVDTRLRRARRISAVGRPRDVAVLDGRAYVSSEGPGFLTGNLSKYDALSGGRLGVIEELVVCSMAAGAEGLWVAGCPNVQQISLEPFLVRRTVVLPYQQPLSAGNYRDELVGVALGAGSVWALGDASDRRLWRIDARSGRILHGVDLPFVPARVAFGEGAVWVSAQLDDVVARIDPSTGRILRTIPVGRGALAVAVGAGAIWVTNSIDGTVSRIDPQTNEVKATIAVRGRPESIVAGADRVWVGTGNAR